MKTPLPIDNLPGQRTLNWRVGRYGDFRQAMLDRLADGTGAFAPLAALRTRAPGDPTIALIDAFAIVGDVLTFYQERLAAENYLGTATEPRSAVELARLTGYRPKGGLAASVFLAFTADAAASLTLPAGARVQSVPAAGQTAQSFETSDSLAVEGAWNALTPRLSRPTAAKSGLERLFVAGTTTGLKRNDPLLLVVDDAPVLRRVAAVTPQPDRKRTLVALQPLPATPSADNDGGDGDEPAAEALESSATPEPAPPTSPAPSLIAIVRDLANRASSPPAANPLNATGLWRTSAALLEPTSDAAVALAAGASPTERSRVYKALAATPLAPAARLEAHAFRSSTAPSGARATKRTVDADGHLLAPPQEWALTTDVFGDPSPLTIVITAEQDASGVAVINLVSEPASAGEGPHIKSAIAYAGAKLDLRVLAKDGEMTTDKLAGVGDVTCTVHASGGALAIGYEFAGRPVSLLVSAGANTPVSVVNRIATSALTGLAVVGRRGDLQVSAMLAKPVGTEATEAAKVLFLDGVFDTIVPGSWVAFDAPADDEGPPPPAPAKVAPRGVATVTRAEYGQTAKVTRLALETAWIDPAKTTFERAIRETAVYADSEPLTLVEEDIVEPHAGPTLELDGFVPGLHAGRWLIVTGERTDLPGSTSAELMMLAGVDHRGRTTTTNPRVSAGGAAYIAGETVHTVLTFAEPLAYSYQPGTLTVLGNVAQATQGESVDEVLGSGSGQVANQSFALKKPPLTYVSAATPSGSASTLRVWVNQVEWREVPGLGACGPTDRVFATQPTPGGGMAVCFGDGVRGSRLPTGSDNVRARYRSGLGASGNVDAGAITLLLSRPLGLKSVTNPLAATGGADAETLEDTRRTAPIGLVSFSRLVAARDYEDFALNFAGIGKASARRFAGADGPLVHVTVAGAGGGALDPTSTLWTSLEQALNDFGDGEHEVVLAAAASRLALINAEVAITPDRLWSDVEPALRKRLFDALGFARRRLGQSLNTSDVIALMHAVPGVLYVDLRLFTSVPVPVDPVELAAAVNGGAVDDIVARLARPDRSGRGGILPAELVTLSDSLPAMLVLNQVTPR